MGRLGEGALRHLVDIEAGVDELETLLARGVDKTTTTTHDAVDLTTDDTDYNSSELDCETYDRFLLSYSLTETGTLVNGDRVRIRIQFRKDGGTWRTYMNGPFGAIYEEESTTPCHLCVSGECLGENMRVVVTTDYTNADPSANYFTVTTEITLVR